MAVKEQKWNGKALRIGELEAEVPIIQGGMGVGISRSWSARPAGRRSHRSFLQNVQRS
mgnify:CR=1 FL=1